MNNIFVWLFLIALVFLAGYEVVSAIMAIRKRIANKKAKKKSEVSKTEVIEEHEEK